MNADLTLRNNETCGFPLQMPMITVRTAYERHGANARYFGHMLNGDFADYMRNRVGPRYRDDEGDQLLSDVDSTGQVDFESEALKIAMQYTPSRLAEVLAECFLMDQHDVLIPYNRLRDATNPNASMAGPDIIGMAGTLLVFGETKSSSESRHPPSVVSGSSGLIEQLNNIKTGQIKRRHMIKWLLHKSGHLQSADRASLFLAARLYYESKGRSFRMCGMLVRDTEPDERDVVKVYDMVSAGMHAPTSLDIMALYIPVPIHSLPAAVVR